MCRHILLLIFAVSVAATDFEFQQRVPCKPLQVQHGQVCVNQANYCDTLEVPIKRSRNGYTLVTSSLSGDRFSYKYGRIIPSDQDGTSDASIEIDRQQKYDGCEFVGWGGGFSGAVSYVLDRLPRNIRSCVYRSYFSSYSGIGLSMLRLTMGGTSFDLEPWTYSEAPEHDVSLPTFTQLDPRDVQRNRQIKEILEVSERRDFKILSAPYSAPPWMKKNNNFVGGANSQLRPEYSQVWADYYVKYLYYMQKDGIRIWAVTSGDEPGVASIVSEFEFMGWKAADQAKWIADYLGPTIRRSEFEKVKIFVFDENRAEIVKYMEEMVASAPHVLNYTDAIAVHGHTDWKSSSTLLDATKQAYPDKPIYMTEKSFGIGNVPAPLKGVLLGSWERAENLTVELIDNLNHGVSAYIYWNFILNNMGGPNYANNFIDSPIIVNEDYTAIYKQPMFYAFAHFKFIPVGSRRLTATISGPDAASIHSVAYSCPDGATAIVLYNFSATKTVTLSVRDGSKGVIRLSVKPKSISSLIY
ncbi:hypothetical protein HA402_012405 [Bradysia odoriphaga]|nr:hypothetical protein HA402_012405 [Bradysia odoriphaga]